MADTESFEDWRWSNQEQSITFRHRQALDFIRRNRDTQPSILDVGCGDGQVLQLLDEEGFTDITGLDLSETAVEKCRNKGFEAHKVNIENGELPFEDDEFDISLMLDIIEHLYQPESSLRRIGQISKKIIIITPNFNSIMARYKVLTGQIPAQNKVTKGHVYWINRNELHQLMHRCGFQIIDEDFYIYKQNSSLRPLVRRIGQLRPEIFATALGVVCKT